jgi:superfamily II DNA or RNA helicase
VSDSTTEFLHNLQRTVGDRLYSEAEQLIESGCVLDLRTLKSGTVVTGTVSSAPSDDPRSKKHRVYIQYRAQSTPSQHAMDSECSCGSKSPCAHIAAVALAALRVTGQPAPGAQPTLVQPASRQASGAPASEQQHLLYLLEPQAGRIQFSVWVAQTHPGRLRIDAKSACPFTLRSSDREDAYPRYVNSDDRLILKQLGKEVTAQVVQHCLDTHRAFWRTLEGTPLRQGGARALQFEWQVLPNGDQQLRSQSEPSAEVLANLEPPHYIDSDTSECGLLQLPHASNILRRTLHRPPVPPELVATVNEELTAEDAAGRFPRLATLTVERQPLSSLKGQLLLDAGPDAILCFLYNGLAVDSRSLRPEDHTVRRTHRSSDGSTVIYETDRDRTAEEHLRAQLDPVLPTTQASPSAWLSFMLHTAPHLQEQGWQIDVTPHFPYRLASEGHWYTHAHASTSSPTRQRTQSQERSRQWFDLKLGLMVDGQPVNLLPVLVSYLQGPAEGANPLPAAFHEVGELLLVRLEDGRFLPVPIEKIRRIADTLVELLDRDESLKEGALELPASQVTRLTELALDLEVAEPRTDEQRILEKLQALKCYAEIAPIPAPEGFAATLRPYQEQGLGWLQFLSRCQFGGILADDMGLGKTIQALAHLAIEQQQGRLTKPVLIVAPVSVIGNWQAEIQRFTPNFKLLTWHGPRRRELFPLFSTADVIITGYPLLQLDAEALQSCEYSYVILDEAQMIKNPRAKVSQIARTLRAEHRLCLTGTPLENHLGELWSLFDFLEPGLLGDERQFQRHYRTPVEKEGNRNRATALARRIAPFMLRRTKDAVARDLPEKTQIVEPIMLEERQRDFYDGIRLSMHQRVREAIARQGLARSHITVLDALLKLRQACCDPRLVVNDPDTRSLPCAKLDWLRTVLPELVAEGRRILLFSQFTSMLGLIETLVGELAIPYLLLTGETQRRADLVARFQRGEAPLFLISLKAGGTGLNLTAADTVIHFDPWWNPAVEAQATDRAHRIGQDKPVFVYKLIAQGTVEEEILKLQAEKQTLAGRMFAGDEPLPKAFTEADLERLFAP